MKKLTWLAVAAVVVASVVACSKLTGGKKETPGPAGPVATEAGAAVEGNYTGAGTNPGGGSYKCDVTVAKAGTVYKVTWYFGGKPGYEGMGVVRGNTFVVGFANSSGYGVVAYTVNADGSLDGTWTGKGATKVGMETLKKK